MRLAESFEEGTRFMAIGQQRGESLQVEEQRAFLHELVDGLLPCEDGGYLGRDGRERRCETVAAGFCARLAQILERGALAVEVQVGGLCRVPREIPCPVGGEFFPFRRKARKPVLRDAKAALRLHETPLYRIMAAHENDKAREQRDAEHRTGHMPIISGSKREDHGEERHAACGDQPPCFAPHRHDSREILLAAIFKERFQHKEFSSILQMIDAFIIA